MRAWAPGDLVTERVRLVRPLAEGGMGAVWVGEHLMLHSQVAVKFMSERFAGDRDLRERFAREARAAVQIRSPHVVQIMDFGVTAEAVPFIVMELCPGESLRARLDRERALPPPALLALARQLASALEAAHASGIVHRDIKPENLLLVPDREGFLLKVLDFGIAKLHGSKLTSAVDGVTIGTLAYMSPEQLFNAAQVDARTDVWSMAVLLHEALTGRSPFPADSVRDLLMSLQSCRCQLSPELPAALVALFQRAFAPDLAARPTSAEAFARAFEAALPGAIAEPARASFAHSPTHLGPLTPPLPGGAPPTSPAAPLTAVPAVPSPRFVTAPARPGVPQRTQLIAAVAVCGLLGVGALGWWALTKSDARASKSGDDEDEPVKPRSDAERRQEVCDHLRGFVDEGKWTKSEYARCLTEAGASCPSAADRDRQFKCLLRSETENAANACISICPKRRASP